MKTKDLSHLNVDAVFCINLKQREDRRKAMLETFRKTGLNIEFLIYDKDKENPGRGCYNSHMDCARLVLERNYKRALILEDDCIIDPFSPGTIGRVNRFLEDKNPELFYLGFLIGEIWLTWRWNIAKCRGVGSHAYIISEEGCKKMLGWGEYTGMAQDGLFRDLFKGYCVFPLICFQNEESPSDLQDCRDRTSGRDAGSISKWFPSAKQRRKQYTNAFKNLRRTLLFKSHCPF